MHSLLLTNEEASYCVGGTLSLSMHQYLFILLNFLGELICWGGQVVLSRVIDLLAQNPRVGWVSSIFSHGDMLKLEVNQLHDTEKMELNLQFPP